MTKITKIAAAVAVTAALALPASQAFAASKTENALIGAAVGALAGTLLSNGDTGAVIAGAAVGGLVGAAADKPDRRRASSRSYQTTRYRTVQPARSYAQPSYRAGYAPQPYGYRGDSYGYQPANSYGYAPQGYRYGY